MEQGREYQPEEGMEPAGEESRRRFLGLAERFAGGGPLNKEDGTKWNGYQLAVNKTARVIRTGVVAKDLCPEDPEATLIVDHQQGAEHTQTRYRLYPDGRMEKDARVESGYEIAKQWRGRPERLEDLSELPEIPEWRKKEKEAAGEAEEQERAMGLLVATEADMREAETVFTEIKDAIHNTKDTGYLKRGKLKEAKKMMREAERKGYENIEEMFRDQE